MREKENAQVEMYKRWIKRQPAQPTPISCECKIERETSWSVSQTKKKWKNASIKVKSQLNRNRIKAADTLKVENECENQFFRRFGDDYDTCVGPELASWLSCIVDWQHRENVDEAISRVYYQRLQWRQLRQFFLNFIFKRRSDSRCRSENGKLSTANETRIL